MENIWNDKNLITVLNKNGVVIMPTDTIYGLVGKAFEKETIERIYNIKKRDFKKPCIILIGDISEVKKFGIELTEEQKNILKEYWSFDSTQDFQPEAVSIVFGCPNLNLSFLDRNIGTIALRLPASDSLRNLLLKTGPLIATSVNPEGLTPAKTTEKAEEYFGDSVDLYIDGGNISEKHSKLIKLNDDDSITVLRE